MSDEHEVRMAEMEAEQRKLDALARERRHAMVMANPRARKRLAEIEAEVTRGLKLVKKQRA